MHPAEHPISACNLHVASTAASSNLARSSLPSVFLDEQRGIARYLRSAGDKIEAKEKSKAALQALFKSMLPHLMTCKVRVLSFRQELQMAEVKEALRSGQDELRREEIIIVVKESPEGGYEAQALGYAIFTQADTMDDLKAMVQDAVQCHFENSLRPRVIRLHLVKDEVILA